MDLFIFQQALFRVNFLFSQTSAYQRVPRPWLGVGQSGDGSFDDAASPGDGFPW